MIKVWDDDVQCADVLMPPSEPHTYSPRVVCQDFVLLLDDAGVHAFVDGVGHDGDVVSFQGNVVGVRELQQLPVLVPAGAGRRC